MFPSYVSSAREGEYVHANTDPTDLAELMILLIWRHLGYYLEDRKTDNYASPDARLLKGANGFKTQSLRSSIDLRTIRQNAQDAFSLVHERLEGLQLVSLFARTAYSDADFVRRRTRLPSVSMQGPTRLC
jgi:hypothetical protein